MALSIIIKLIGEKLLKQIVRKFIIEALWRLKKKDLIKGSSADELLIKLLISEVGRG